jgi:hypothetical protein
LCSSIFQYWDNRQRDKLAKKSQISISVSTPWKGEVTFSKLPASSDGLVARVEFDVTVFNTGLVGDSFSSWYFSETELKDKETFHTHAHHKARLMNADGSIPIFPMQIAPRETRKLRLQVGLRIDPKAMMERGFKFELGKTFRCGQLSQIFADQNQYFLGEYFNHEMRTLDGIRYLELSAKDTLHIGFSQLETGSISRAFSPSYDCGGDPDLPHSVRPIY